MDTPLFTFDADCDVASGVNIKAFGGVGAAGLEARYVVRAARDRQNAFGIDDSLVTPHHQLIGSSATCHADAVVVHLDERHCRRHRHVTIRILKDTILKTCNEVVRCSNVQAECWDSVPANRVKYVR